MKIRIKKVSDYIHLTRGIYIGDVYEVIQANNNLGTFENETGYLIQPRKGNPITVYATECEPTDDNVTKNYTTKKVLITVILLMFLI